MQNIVEKYTDDSVVSMDEDGVVAIEYVLIAGLVAAGVAITFATGLWEKMKTSLNGLIK
jgi:Flp pilus assembly pilin Flp